MSVSPVSTVLRVSPQRLTVDKVDVFIADLKDAVREAKEQPSGKGSMVAVYGARSIIPMLPLHVVHTSIIQAWVTPARWDRPWLGSWQRRFWTPCTRRNLAQLDLIFMRRHVHRERTERRTGSKKHNNSRYRCRSLENQSDMMYLVHHLPGLDVDVSSSKWKWRPDRRSRAPSACLQG